VGKLTVTNKSFESATQTVSDKLQQAKNSITERLSSLRNSAPSSTRVSPDRLLSEINTQINRADVQPGVPNYFGTPSTWCNRAANRIATNLGANTNPLLDRHPQTGQPDINYTDASEIHQNAAIGSRNSNSGVVRVTPRQAQRLASQGNVVIATQDAPRDANNNIEGSGHVGIVAPNSARYDFNRGPRIGQAGAVGVHGIRYSNQSFNPALPVTYYQLR
jgi:hypothetical protein